MTLSIYIEKKLEEFRKKFSSIGKYQESYGIASYTSCEEELKSFFSSSLQDLAKEMAKEVRLEEIRPIDRKRNVYHEDKMKFYHRIKKELDKKIDNYLGKSK